MKDNLVEMVFILDRSGSMAGFEADTIGGFNSLIEKQKEEPGEAYVTTVLFDDKYELLHDHVNIKDVPALTIKEYRPRGMTALLDAVGRTINSIGERLANTPEDERPSQVMIMITTDGYENASKEFKLDQVRQMIQHQQEKYSWLFMFLGADMNAVNEAKKIGIDTAYAKTYTKSTVGVSSVYESVSASMSIGRSMATLDSLSSDSAADARKAMAEALDNVE